MDILTFIQQELPKIIRRYFILLIGASFIAAYSTYYITAADPTIYQAKARLLIGPKINSLNTDFDDLRIGGGLVQTYAELAETRPLLQNANDQLNLGLNAVQIDDLVEIRSNTDTRIIAIIVQNQDPGTAIDIANSLSESLLNLSPTPLDAGQPTLAQLQVDIDLLQQTILDTQIYIKTLESEYTSLQAQTQDISLEDIALISQFQNIDSELSLERSRLSNAIRTQGSNYGTLNDNRWATSSDASKLKLHIISHIDQTEELIQDASLRVERLSAELKNFDSDFDYTSYFLTLSLIDRQNEIEKLLSQERARLGDQIRTLSATIDVFSTVGTNPNQVTIIESADTANEINNLLEIKVASSAVAGLLAALVIVIFIEMLRTPSIPSTQEADDITKIAVSKTKKADGTTKKADSNNDKKSKR